MAVSAAERKAQRASDAHTRATTGVWRRCMIEGCRVYRVAEWAPDAATSRQQQEAHYLAEHYVPGGAPVSRR